MNTSTNVCMFEHEYMYKPCVLEEFMKKTNCPRKEWSDSEEDTSRIGNTPCGKYKPMATHAESICCLDKYQSYEMFFNYFYLVIY